MRGGRDLVLLVAFAIFLLGLGPCGKKTTWKEREFEKTTISRQADQVPLPESLWKKIEALSPESVGKTLPTEFVPVTVYLVEKNRGILNRSALQIEYGIGGGELDLKDFLLPLNGSFYFNIEFLAEKLPDSGAAVKRVFFLSNAKTQEDGKQTLGAGCDTYLDISTAYAQAVPKGGFLVNTSQGRHVRALAGTYFFAASHEGKLYLSSLIVRDSRFPRLHCR